MPNNTKNRRIYAIGDIHGCLSELEAMQADIRADLLARPHDNPVIMYMGDFTDRGPDSRGVIDNLIAESKAPHRTHFLRGNHDQMFLNYLEHPTSKYYIELHWFDDRVGGVQTLESYGVMGANDGAPSVPHSAFDTAVPADHRQFLGMLELMVPYGSYLFVHAGIRPKVPVYAQKKDDMLWIREPFLSSDVDHGFTVVHGHTVVDRVENFGNRIGIDTGAVFDGELSCLVLEGEDQHLLKGCELVPCPVEVNRSTDRPKPACGS